MHLIQNDCLKFLKKIPNNVIDLILIDPPFKTTPHGSSGLGGIFGSNTEYGHKLFKNNNIKLEDYINELYRVLKEESHCYIFCNQKNLYSFLKTINEKSEFKVFKTLIWVKNNKIANQFYMNQSEFILFLRKGKAKKINNCSTSEVLMFDNKKTKINNKNIHPTEKPVDLLETLIKNSTSENEIVLDCFMGSGSTGVACKNTNRDFIGIELDEQYFNIAKERILSTDVIK